MFSGGIERDRGMKWVKGLTNTKNHNLKEFSNQ